MCGSATSVMTGILSDTSPMRVQAAPDLPRASFDYRHARGSRVSTIGGGFTVDSIVGEAAGYKTRPQLWRPPSLPR